MRPGRHTAADGSFGRSAGAAAGRGALLLAVAVALGLVLLQAADDAPPGGGVAASDRSDGDVAEATTSTSSSSTTAPARPPAQVKVLVVNGSGVRQAAAKASEKLKPDGYNLLAPVDGKPTETSSVYFATTFESDAAAVAAKLALPAGSVKPMPAPPPVTNIRDAGVVVHVGPELAERLASGG